MNAEELLRAGQVDEAMASLREAVKKSPAEPKLRAFLFQLLCVNGQWDKALTQLTVLSEMDPASLLMAQVVAPIVHCEAFRAEVLAGRRAPVIFGEPEEWISLLVQASQLGVEGKWDAARELRDRAFDAAPAVSGKINDEAFAWIADADSRLGPILEVLLDGKYYWVPFSRIRSMQIEAPAELRDFVWIAAKFIWTNGGEGAGFIPVRYPGTESSADGLLRCGRKTEWIEKAPELYTGMGQRMLTTDQGDYPLLDIRSLTLGEAPPIAGTDAPQ